MNYFQPYSHSKNKMEVELDLFNYATKSELKIATGVDTSKIVKKDDLDNLKSMFDKFGIDKFPELDADELKPVPVDLKKISDVVDKKSCNKDVYNVQ